MGSPLNTGNQAEKTVIVAVGEPGAPQWRLERSLGELGRLVETAGGAVVEQVTQTKGRPNPKLFIGKGKAQGIKAVAAANGATSIIFDDELSPSQQLNLEELIKVKVIDRTALILDIFAQHAHSSEGNLQVELAQHRYYLPRLKGLWLHLSRQQGGIGTRGPGETQLETDRRRLNTKIKYLDGKLKALEKTRKTQRSARKRESLFSVALVGYTNAGKSSLLKMLTGADVYIADQLFATLDSTTRRTALPSGAAIAVSDTVGFIDKLPHELVAAFKSTLDEVVDADLLVHVVDCSDSELEEQVESVTTVLGEIGAGEIPRMIVYNKSDMVDAATRTGLEKTPEAVLTSCVDGTGAASLMAAIDKRLMAEMAKITMKIPYDQGSSIQWLFTEGIVVKEEHLADGYLVTGYVKHRDLPKIKRFLVE